MGGFLTTNGEKNGGVNVMRQPILVLLLCVAFAGCASEDRNSAQECQKKLLEDLFEMNRMSVLGSGNYFHHVAYALKPGVDRNYAAAEIVAYLRNEPGCRATVFEIPKGFVVDYDNLHARDFWAMVLAKMNGIDLSIQATRGPHEDQIAEVLAKVEAQARKVND